MGKSIFSQLSKHVYWLSPDESTDRPVLGAIVGEKGTLIVDTGNSLAHAQLLLDGIQREGLPAVRYVVLTHAHWDHFFGSAAFNIPLIAQRETAAIIRTQAGYDWSDAALDQRVKAGLEIEFCRDMIKLELPDRRDLKLVVPDILFENKLTIDLGNLMCDIVHVGGDHASDSCVVVAEKVMFLGDCISAAVYAPQQHYTARLLPLLDSLLALDADTYLHGHADQPMPRAELEGMATEARAVYHAIAEMGSAKQAVLQRLSETVPNPLDQDELEWMVEMFLAGVG